MTSRRGERTGAAAASPSLDRREWTSWAESLTPLGGPLFRSLPVSGAGPTLVDRDAGESSAAARALLDRPATYILGQAALLDTARTMGPRASSI